MRVYLVFYFILISFAGFSQAQYQMASKPAVDTSVFNKWPTLGATLICNNGDYFIYTINNQPIGNKTLVIQSVNKGWIREFIGGTEPFFTNNNKLAIFRNGDILHLLSLESNTLKSISNVAFVRYPSDGVSNWFAYLLKDSTRGLVLYDFYNGEEQKFTGVTDFVFSHDGKTLLLNTQTSQNSKCKLALQMVNIPEKKSEIIWSSEFMLNTCVRVSRLTFDNTGNQLCFFVNESNQIQDQNAVWYYKKGMTEAVKWVDNQSNGLAAEYYINNGNIQFSKNGNWIFLKLQKRANPEKKENDIAKLSVWSYKDVFLQSEQLEKPTTNVIAIASTSVKGKVLSIGMDGESIWTKPSQITEDYIVVCDNKSFNDFWWNFTPNSYYLYSIRDTSKVLLKKGKLSYQETIVSPNGRYLIYYDFGEKQYYSYDFKSKKTINISKDISSRLDNEYSNTVSLRHSPVGIAGWLKNDSAMFIYDNYDLWMVDPVGVKMPVNVTNGYGKLNNIKLRLVEEKGVINDSDGKTPLLLTGFNVINKFNGFFNLYLNRRKNPERLVMGPYTFFHRDSQLPDTWLEIHIPGPVKARDENIWIVQRMSAIESPNYFLTKDFKNYTALTNLQPQKFFNWLTTELVNWKQLDGTNSQGILYKPENFNPKKKYPIIFWYYEQASYRMYEFIEPNFFDGDINIPFLVSQGYLVFTPDIHFSIASISGKTTYSNAYNSVVSAAMYLAKLGYVDSKKMAIQGHSFAGGQTNYIITKSNLFAAAAESAGTSNFISTYLSLAGPIGKFGGERQQNSEMNQGRMGKNLWQNIDLYIENSPVLKANKVNTPFLIVHNMGDPSVPWAQGMEMYLALRRLNKKVWMLQYDEGSHYVFGKDAADYTIRLNQFFDHYLKDKPAPKWMTYGIPASKKGIDLGLELDFEGVCGNNCTICKKNILNNIKK